MPGTRWSAAEVELLKTELARVLSPREIAVAVRTANGIRNKAARLGLIGDGISRRRWLPQQERTLRRLVDQGWGPRRIAREGKLPHSPVAIRTKASRLGLVDPGRSKRARAVVRLTPAQQHELVAFLRVTAAIRTPEEIALLWNGTHEPSISRGRVIYYLVQHGLKRPRCEVLQMPYSRAKRRWSQRVIVVQQHRWQRYRRDLRRWLVAQARRLRQSSQGACLTQERCTQCGDQWPACVPFFVVHQKMTRTGRHGYVGRYCRFCANARRRERRALRRTVCLSP